MESPAATPIGQQATIVSMLFPPPCGSDDPEGHPGWAVSKPWIPFLPLSFLVQKGTKYPSMGYVTKLCPVQTLLPGPGQRPWGREGSQLDQPELPQKVMPIWC